MSSASPEIRTVNVTRYITPLMEGGSMPAVSEADDEFLYVVKFRGAGQGPKALIAELIGGQIARLGKLNVPELVFAYLDEAFGRTEPDPEIQDLLKASKGRNLGVHFLKGAATYDPAMVAIDELLASKIVWLDCFILNVDRTAMNTNMLLWHKELWLIDHGAALYFHHSWTNYKQKALMPFDRVTSHVLLPYANRLAEADKWFHQHLSEETLRGVVDIIPDDWLLLDTPFHSIESNKDAYTDFLLTRLQHSDNFVNHASDARKALI